MAFLLNTLGQLWLAGIVDWSGFYASSDVIVSPADLSLERQRYWIEPQKQADAVNTPQKALQDTQQSQKADSSLHARPSSQNAYFAPRNEVEQTMADIWQEPGIEQVGIQDNFFELGGHSLLAVRLFAQIKKIFGLELPVANLFQAPRLSNLLASDQSGSLARLSSLVKNSARWF